MFGKLLNSVTWQVRADLRRKLKANRDHKNLSWNLAERLQVYCSTHYIRAMLILWGVAAGAVAVAHYARPVFDPFARQHFKGITALPGWMSSLLGSQVTLIGIVFPLVVGLISVLFQKIIPDSYPVCLSAEFRVYVCRIKRPFPGGLYSDGGDSVVTRG
ncbi:TPA: hypothetical protein HHG09_004605 [Escherichia coli]|nr:hypothetical protein [Escherichia coli]